MEEHIPHEGVLPPHKENMRREVDSVDDFEHLGHDVGDSGFDIQQPRVDSTATAAAAAATELINTGSVAAASDAANERDQFKAPEADLIGISPSVDTRDSVMDATSNLLELADTESSKHQAEDNLLEDLSYAPPVPPHADTSALFSTHEDDIIDFLGGGSAATKSTLQSFMDNERDIAEPLKMTSAFNDLADKFTDSEPEEDFKHAVPRADSPTAGQQPVDDILFKDVISESVRDPSPEPLIKAKPPTPPPVKREPTPPPPVPERVEEVKKDLPKPTAPPVEAVEVCPKPPTKKQTRVGAMKAEEMFCKMGLDTWFNPDRLHPTVEALVYWRDPTRSGIVFGGGLAVLLSLAYFSLISVMAYASLLTLVGTIAFRIYKNVMQAVQKTSDGHPFKELLELDLTLPQDRVQQISELVTAHINGALTELRRLFLVEDLVDSIKFGVLLWCLTYVGAWFNGMTLVIIGFVALFTLPKVYETNKTQIDANLELVRTKLDEITSKVKAAMPIGKKPEEKKEQ